MKILVIGATGNLGACVVSEALSRGHDVTAVSRSLHAADSFPGVRWVAIDARDSEALTTTATGQDAIVCAISPWSAAGRDGYLAVIRSVITAVGEASVGYVLFSGGASSLMLPDGRRVIDVQREQSRNDDRVRLMLEEAAEPVYEAYGQIRNSDVQWTFLSPAGHLEDGPRSGTYRSAGDVPITGTQTNGRISFADFAVAAVDELESREHTRAQFNVAY